MLKCRNFFLLPVIIGYFLLFYSLSASAQDFDAALLTLQKQWAKANYQTDEKQLETVFKKLKQQAQTLVDKYPKKAEPLIWQAIILSSDAGKNGGLSALGKVKKARQLLLQAEKINPNALDGSIYTSLGSLYYQVPGWPIGFGDDEQAEKYLKKALEINPKGIDPNYFYADFLLDQKRYKEAKNYFDRAFNAPPRATRPIADQGRKDEIKAKLKALQEELKE